MRAFITGSNGFVGRHLEGHLQRSGDDVRGVDMDCDVTDLESVTRAMRDWHPEVIYHLAALTHVGESWNEPALFNRVNVLGTANVLKAARTVAPDALVLLVSSADVYGVVRESDLPLTETHHPVPVNPYAQSKREAEQIAFDAFRTEHQRVIVTRPFNHVGPGQSVQFVVPALVNRLLDAREQGLREIAVGDLSARRDFSDVRDVVRAYRLLMQYGQSGEVYNVASGADVALTDLAHSLVEMLCPDVQLVEDPSLMRPVEIPIMRGSIEKLHELTGWEPSIPLATSLNDVVEDLRSRRR
jgi:GDP-4-dehydro-6-deoxy-D-mannose reductase